MQIDEFRVAETLKVAAVCFCVAKSGPNTDTIKTIWDFNSQHIQQYCGDFANNNWNHCGSMIACRLDV